MVTKKCPECGQKTFTYFPMHMDGPRKKWECSSCDYEEQPSDEERLADMHTVGSSRK